MSRIRDEYPIDDIGGDEFAGELFGSKDFLLELVSDAIYKTSSLKTLPERITSRIKWFIDNALDIPLSILIYTGAVFVPAVFRINDKDIVRVEGIFGQSLRELGARTINILLKPNLILNYIDKKIRSSSEASPGNTSIIGFLKPPLGISHRRASIRELTRIKHEFKKYFPTLSPAHYSPIIFLAFLNSWYRLLKDVLYYESREGYVPIPVKSRITAESINNVLDELEIWVKKTRRKSSKSEFLVTYLVTYIVYLKETASTLARIKLSLEENESEITFMKLSLQDYDSLARFILQAKEKGVDRATIRAIVLDKLYLKTIIPATTVASDLVELAINLFSGRLREDDFSRLQNKLYKYKTKFNQAVNNVKDAVKDNILELDMGSIELVDKRSQRIYQYLSDKIRVFREAPPTYL